MLINSFTCDSISRSSSDHSITKCLQLSDEADHNWTTEKEDVTSSLQYTIESGSIDSHKSHNRDSESQLN